MTFFSEKAFIFDRDGILNKETGKYVSQENDFILSEELVEWMLALKEAGFLFFVITNQGGVSKGETAVETIDVLHRKMKHFFGTFGLVFQEIYVCYHHPSVSQCLCRKPESLFFERCIHKYRCDPRKSFMIGDRERDLIPAKKLGMNTILICPETSPYADYHFPELNSLTERNSVPFFEA